MDLTGQAPPAVMVRGLTFRYPDGRTALRGIDMTLGRGETVGLVGPNGAGKSTLLLHLNGLLPGKRPAPLAHHHGEDPGEAASGAPSVWIDGIEVNARNGPEVRRRVGLVFQDPDDQLFATTVLEDVAFGPLNLGKPRGVARALALTCLERVGLADAGGRMPHHLSFGERKRVCLAGVLACEPSVLVLDEPTANLDPRNRRQFIELIGSLEATRLIATHDLEMVVELCERTLVIDEGRIVAAGPTRHVLGDGRLMHEHGLEVPFSLRAAATVDRASRRDGGETIRPL